MGRKAFFSYLMLVLPVVLFLPVNVMAAPVPAASVIQSIDGPVPAEESAAQLLVDCFYAANRGLTQCAPASRGGSLTEAAREGTTQSIDGPVPAEEDSRGLAMDCFYAANRSRAPCI